ncbi:MAG: ABC transporter ATP-binding protein [Thermomicrobiales bacterium]|nr:ABC transporter ATP-binding protein [Thermomicrobiales bacterium]MCO5220520.1 ABC transporter ATP-binding protein [Thermomicrobiales bacterium]
MSLSVDFDRVTVQFDDRRALSDLTVHLDGGKIYGLLGRNGAGKSTLLSLLGALRKPTSGRVLVDGQELFENDVLTPQVALIRESPDVLDTDEKLDYNLEFAAQMRPGWDEPYARELVRKFAIPDDQKIDTFSRGQRSALGIVIGLASRTPLTMFDESYLGLDTPSRYLFYQELLADFMRFQRTVIVSTHLIDEVAPLFEETLIIDSGKLLVQGETDALRARARRFTGNAGTVDEVLRGEQQRGVQQLGSTKSAVVVSDRIAELDTEGRTAGLEVEPVGLQDLFVYLTQEQEVAVQR